MKNKIEAIETKLFHGTHDYDTAYLEAYTDEATYIITLGIKLMRDAYTSPQTLDYIREYDEWINDKAWIKEYFLNHINDIETLEK